MHSNLRLHKSGAVAAACISLLPVDANGQQLSLAHRPKHIPASAGIPDLLQMLVQLTQSRLAQRLMFINELQATVLEVRSCGPAPLIMPPFSRALVPSRLKMR